MLATGCADEPDDSSPDGALALFLEALDRSADQDPTALEDAYALLDESSRLRLSDRARSATALGAREIDPWEMLVDGRPIVRFTPRRGGGLRSRMGTAPDTAVVIVTGEGERQRAEISMRLEDEGWRVVLAIPDVQTAAAREAREHPAPEP